MSAKVGDTPGVHRFRRLVLVRPPTDTEAFPEDVKRIQAALESAGYTTTRRECALAWEQYSETMCAGWLMLPSRDVDILQVLLGTPDPEDDTGNGDPGPYFKVSAEVS